MEGACDACGLAQVGSILPYVLPLLALALAACGWCCAGRRCPAARRRLVDRLCCRRPHLQRLAEPLLEKSEEKIDEFRAAYRQWRTGCSQGATSSQEQKLRPFLSSVYQQGVYRELLDENVATTGAYAEFAAA